MEEIQKLTKIVENYFRETKIRSFRATKINKNRGLIFKDNYCQFGCQLSSILRLTFVWVGRATRRWQPIQNRLRRATEAIGYGL